MPRILWYSNSPDIPTGYGVQTKQVAGRMARDGHDVHVHGNFGHRAGFRMVDGMTVWPEGIDRYSLDIASEFARMVEPDVIFTLYDVWVMKPRRTGSTGASSVGRPSTTGRPRPTS